MRRFGKILIVFTIIFGLIFDAKASPISADTGNLLLNKPVVASSFEVAATAPENVVDGNPETRWGTDQNMAADEWIEVDMGVDEAIEYIVVKFERADADQNILGFNVQVAKDDVYTTVYETSERAKQEVEIRLENVVGSKIKVNILEADGGTLGWVNVGITEIEAYGQAPVFVEDAANVNHARTAQMTASTVEENLDRLGASKANDGDLDTRWASNYTDTQKQWLRADFEELTLVKSIDLNFLNRDISPNDSNIEQFSVKYIDGQDEEHYLFENFENNRLGADKGWNTRNLLVLDEAVIAKSIIISEFVANSTAYNNISITEMAIYSNNRVEKQTLEAVVASIQGGNVELDQETFVLPEVPEGFEIISNGADFEQIIALDGTIVRPLTDKLVKVSFKVTDLETGISKVTNDYNFIVKGIHQPNVEANSKPVVIPELAEWHSTSSDVLTVGQLTKITYTDPALKLVVDEFISDYHETTGVLLSAELGSAAVNAINFNLAAPDALLGEEGYTLDILEDRINVQSEATTGNMYGMQSILQMITTNDSGFSLGSMRDYPRFEVRGFLFDVARKPVSLEMIKDVSRSMRYYKMNDFQIHLSDNYIFLEHYGFGEEEHLAFDAYEAFRLESGLTNEKGEGPTAEDYSFSKDQFRTLIEEERALGMAIVPEIDVPAHATSFTKVWPEIMVENQVSRLNNKRPLIDHIDVSEQVALDKIKEIFDDYTKGENPTFDADTIVHIGADEFLSDYTAYREFLNEIVPYIAETNTVRMWGGLTWIDDNKTEIIPEAIDGVQMNLWSADWADGLQMYNMGYDLINTIDNYGYIVPNGNLTRANAYGDLLNIERIFDSFEPNRVRTRSGYVTLPSGDAQILGAVFALWNDNIDKLSNGLTESDLFYRIFDALPFYAETTWAETGKEKGSAKELQEISNLLGSGPGTNPYYQEESVDGKHLELDFADEKDGVLKLDQPTSHLETGKGVLGNGNELTFDILLDTPSKPGDILFEVDAPYGTHDIRIMPNGALGFTREIHDYFFDYELPVGKEVTITITVEQQKTKLYVDGKYVSDAVGQFNHKGILKKDGIRNSTFALPLARIGSTTQAIQAKIDNVLVSESEVKVPTDKFQKSKWTGTTDTETIYDAREGKLIYAFDDKPNTHWHSNWQGASDKLTGSNTFYAEIDFNEKHLINEFAFTPRVDQPSGLVTKADLFIKANAADEWKLVAENQEFAANQSEKSFNFDEQEVQFVKFVAKTSNDGWVAVSEFDVYNRPAASVVLYVSATEGGSVTGGTEGMTGETHTIVATPDAGYQFVGWYDSADQLISDQASYDVLLTKNTALIAKFEKTVESVDTKALEKVLAEAKAMDLDLYTDDSVAALNKVVAEVELLLTTEPTQEAVDGALVKLNAAMDQLVEKAVESVDTKALEKALADAKSIDLDLYTAESTEILSSIIKQAEVLLANNPDQKDVDAILSKLNDAIGGLVAKTDKPEIPVKPVDPVEPESGDPTDTEKPVLPGTGIGVSSSIVLFSGMILLGFVLITFKKRENEL